MSVISPQSNISQEALELAIKSHFAQKQLPDFSGYLLEDIRARLRYEQQLRDLKPRIWGAVAVLTASVALLLFALEVSFKAFAQTPTWHYLSLSFTDFGVVLDNWQDYGFSVLESLPLGAMAFVLAALTASLYLGDFTVHQMSKFRRLSHSYHPFR